jgi:hypothetical protein
LAGSEDTPPRQKNAARPAAGHAAAVRGARRQERGRRDCRRAKKNPPAKTGGLSRPTQLVLALALSALVALLAAAASGILLLLVRPTAALLTALASGVLLLLAGLLLSAALLLSAVFALLVLLARLLLLATLAPLITLVHVHYSPREKSRRRGNSSCMALFRYARTCAS